MSCRCVLIQKQMRTGSLNSHIQHKMPHPASGTQLQGLPMGYKLIKNAVTFYVIFKIQHTFCGMAHNSTDSYVSTYDWRLITYKPPNELSEIIDTGIQEIRSLPKVLWRLQFSVLERVIRPGRLPYAPSHIHREVIRVKWHRKNHLSCHRREKKVYWNWPGEFLLWPLSHDLFLSSQALHFSIITNSPS